MIPEQFREIADAVANQHRVGRTPPLEIHGEAKFRESLAAAEERLRKFAATIPKRKKR
jgi:hypothetical protein